MRIRLFLLGWLLIVYDPDTDSAYILSNMRGEANCVWMKDQYVGSRVRKTCIADSIQEILSQ